MELKRYALFVDAAGGKSLKLVPVLKDLGVRALPTTTLGQAIDMIIKSPGLVMAVVSDAMGPVSSKAFASTVRSLYPQMPIVWVSALSLPPDAAMGPSLTLQSEFDPETSRAQVTRLLRDGHYPLEIVEALQNAVSQALRESYRTPIVRQEAFLRFSKELLANVSALISFSGGGLSGRLVIGGTVEWFETLLSQSQKRHPDAELDIAGELGNRILGRFKEFFETRGLAVSQTPPVLVLGRGLQLREQDGVSVAVRCSLNAQDTNALFADLSLKGPLADFVKRPATAPVQSSGDATFL